MWHQEYTTQGGQWCENQGFCVNVEEVRHQTFYRGVHIGSGEAVLETRYDSRRGVRFARLRVSNHTARLECLEYPIVITTTDSYCLADAYDQVSRLVTFARGELKANRDVSGALKTGLVARGRSIVVEF